MKPSLTESAFTFELFPCGTKLKIKADSLTIEEKCGLGVLGELEKQRQWETIKIQNCKQRKVK